MHVIKSTRLSSSGFASGSSKVTNCVRLLKSLGRRLDLSHLLCFPGSHHASMFYYAGYLYNGWREIHVCLKSLQPCFNYYFTFRLLWQWWSLPLLFTFLGRFQLFGGSVLLSFSLFSCSDGNTQVHVDEAVLLNMYCTYFLIFNKISYLCSTFSLPVQ